MKFGGLGGILNFMPCHRSVCFHGIGCVDLKRVLSIFAPFVFSFVFLLLSRLVGQWPSGGLGLEVSAGPIPIDWWARVGTPTPPNLSVTQAQIPLGHFSARFNNEMGLGNLFHVRLPRPPPTLLFSFRCTTRAREILRGHWENERETEA